MHSSNLWLQYFESRYVCLFEMLSTYMYAEDGTLVKRKKSMLCSNAIFFCFRCDKLYKNSSC